MTNQSHTILLYFLIIFREMFGDGTILCLPPLLCMYSFLVAYFSRLEMSELL